MTTNKIIMGKKVLIIDDERDILEILTELLVLCKIDTASSFDEARDLLENNDYDIIILDIMGVSGFDLLEMATKKSIPTLMLTAYALTEDDLKKSAESGAAYFVPKEEMSQIATFVADVLEAREKKKNPWTKWMDRLGGYFDVTFTGPNWRKREKEFWDKIMRKPWW
jgi:DNA-binding NtrC family response regulator